MAKQNFETSFFEYPKIFLKRETFCMRLTSLWKPYCCSQWKGILNFIGRIIIFGIFFTMNSILVPLGSIQNYEIGDFLRLMDSIVFGSAYIAATYKCYMFIVRQNVIMKCITVLDQESKQYNSSSIDRALKLSHKIYSIISYGSVLTLAVYAMTPIIKQTIFSNFSKKLPFTLLFPSNSLDSSFYGIWYTYQTVTLLTVVWMNITFDAVFYGLVLMCVAFLQSINLLIKEYEECLTTTAMNNESQEKKLEIILEKYSDTIRYIRNINCAFSDINLVHFFQNYFILAQCAFQVLQNGLDVRLISMFGGVFIAAVSLTLHCFVGQKLINEINQFRRLIYEIPWYDESKNIKRMILLTLRYSELTKLLTAGEVITLSWPTLKDILRAFISLITFLFNVKS